MIRHFRRSLAAVVLVAFLAPVAAAQSLGELAPADALFVLDVERPSDLGSSLHDALASLDWEGARATLETLGALLGDDLVHLLDLEPLDLLYGEGPFEELAAECPELPTDVDPKALVSSGILTIGMSSASPFPVVTAIARVPADQADAAERVQDALVACFGSDVQTQDGIEITILGQGSDLPLAVARSANLYVAASSPDAVRAVLRRAAGSDEPSLADVPFWSAADRFEGEGFGFGVNIAAAMDVIAAFTGGGRSDDPAEAYLQQRLLAVGRTFGGLVMRAGVTGEGVLFESLVAVDPEGGDDALADLLLCTECGVSRPLLAPDGATAVASQHVDLRGLVAYVQDWLDGFAEATGEELDLRAMTREALGIDLDEALLDWIGTQFHMVTLEPFRPTLQQLAYQQPTAMIVPVASPEAAKAGLDILGGALGPAVRDLLSGSGPRLGRGFGPMGPGGLGRFGGDIGADAGMFAARSETYRDVSYHRLQFGPLLDVAVALVGNHLVIASPSPAVETIIDTYRGDTASLDSRAFQQSRRLAPPGAPSIAFADVGADLDGVAQLLRLLSQPAAAAIAVGVQEATEGPEAPGPRTTAPAPAEAIAYGELPVETAGVLTGGATNDFGEIVDRYRLTGFPAGERIRVTLQSDAFDGYLYLRDETGAVLASNDDSDFGRDSELTFLADGRTYVLEASSFGGASTGPYTLTLEQGSLEDLPQIDVRGVRPEPIQPPVQLDDALQGNDVVPGGDVARYYALEGLSPGQSVEVELTSDAFDTYLRIVHPDAGVILAENDDNPDTSRSAVTFGASGDPVWIQVSSWGGSSTGPFTLDIRVRQPSASGMGASEAPPMAAVDGDEPAEPVEPPTFASLLDLTEIVPDAVAILADHVGFAFGYAEIDGNVVYRRSLLEVDW